MFIYIERERERHIHTCSNINHETMKTNCAACFVPTCNGGF